MALLQYLMKMKQKRLQVCSYVNSWIYLPYYKLLFHFNFLIDVIYYYFLVDTEHPNVVSMFLNKRYELHTTRSWNFLGLETDGGFANDSVWKKSLGEDIIIGNLDTGNQI